MRVAVIVLSAVLLCFTVALFIQVGSGPRLEGDVRAASDEAKEAPDERGERGERGSRKGREARQDGESRGGRATRISSSAAFDESDEANEGRPRPGRAAGDGSGAPSVASLSNLSFDEANKLYDRREYEEARALALTLLREHPSSVRMRRVVIASSCIMGDHEIAQQHYLILPEQSRDRSDMRERCLSYGSSFHE